MVLTSNDSLKCLICDIKFDSFKDKIKHIKNNHSMSYEQYIIKIYYNNERPTCQCGCGTILSFKSLKNGPWFSKYTKNHWKHKKHTKETIDKIRNSVKHSIYEKYKVNNISELPETIEKIKKTKLYKYGNENYNNSKKNAINQKIKFYKKLLNSNRLTKQYTPLFNVSEYNGVSNKYKFKCNMCNNEFTDNLDNGSIPRCKICFPIDKKTSFAEKEIVSYIKSITSDLIIENDTSILPNNIELDIFIPNKNIAFEYNGIYWHSELSGNKKKWYHRYKTDQCNKKDIKLIHIFEDEWILKNDIVKNKIKNLLQLNTEYIYARKCKIIPITIKQKNEFLNKYHIQGKDSSSIQVGLEYNSNLVSVMTFSNKRIALGSNATIKSEYELVRYCSSTRVIGGASKLLTYFIKTYKPSKILSYADYRWSNGNLYSKLKFQLIGNTTPNYWYVKKGTINRIHRFTYRKNVLSKKLSVFDNNLSEWQNMQLNDFDRIWDCGSIKFEMSV